MTTLADRGTELAGAGRDEPARLAALHRLGVLDTEAERDFDDLTRLAAQLCATPMATVTLIDADRQWFKSRLGVAGCGNPREVSLCAVAIEQGEPLVVTDTLRDPRFADNPLVTGAPSIRFYAGVPLVVDGLALGTLCVMDVEPRALSGVQLDQLRTLARQVTSLLELRRDRRELSGQVLARARAEEAIRRSETRFRAVFDQSPIGMAECDPNGTLVDVNDGLARLLGYDRADLVGVAAASLLADPASAAEQRADIDSLAEHVSYAACRDYRRRDGSIVSMQVGVAALRDDLGAVARLLVTCTDISARVAAEQELSAMHEELRRRQIFTDAVLDSVDVGIVACDADGALTVFNSTSKIWHGMGVDGGHDGSGLASRFDLYDEDGSTPLSEERIPLLRALRSGSVEDAEIVISPHELPATRVQCSGQSLIDADGRLLGAVVAMSDITQTRAQQAALQASETRFRATFDNDPAGLAVLTGGGLVMQVNTAFAELFGLPGVRCEGTDLGALLDDATRAGLVDMTAAAARHPGRPFTQEKQVRTAAGAARWCLLTVIDLPDPQTGRCTLLQAEDITARRETEQRLTRQALSDPLTGLPNRVMLLDHVRLAVARLERHPAEQAYVLFCDLDGFKAVNDEHGHDAGDRLLKEIAARLKATLRPADTVARLGGDEFVVLCEQLAGPDDADHVACRVAAALAEPVRFDGLTLRVTASIGVAAAAAGAGAEDLLRRADAAMYRAKNLGKNRHVIDGESSRTP